jgi:hypothetical protein
MLIKELSGALLKDALLIMVELVYQSSQFGDIAFAKFALLGKMTDKRSDLTAE